MNAYELAEKMDYGKYDWADEAAKMLRQQADRIAELEKVIKEAVEAFNDASDGAGVNFYAYAEEWKTKLANTTPQTKSLTDEKIRELEELLGRYWTLAYKEGKHGLNLADEANDVLMRFRAIVRGEK
jgi:gas vesicle protein